MMLEEKLEFTISLDRLQRKEVVEALNELMTALREADTEEDQKSEGCRSASSEPTNGALHRAPGEGHPPRSKGRQKRVKGPNTPEDFWGFSVEKIEETLGLTTDRVPHEHNSRDYGALQDPPERQGPRRSSRIARPLVQEAGSPLANLAGQGSGLPLRRLIFSPPLCDT
jgi:hypothetical protein